MNTFYTILFSFSKIEHIAKRETIKIEKEIKVIK